MYVLERSVELLNLHITTIPRLPRYNKITSSLAARNADLDLLEAYFYLTLTVPGGYTQRTPTSSFFNITLAILMVEHRYYPVNLSCNKPELFRLERSRTVDIFDKISKFFLNSFFRYTQD